MERHIRPQPKVGYFGSGLAAYWPQFPALKPAVLETMDRQQALGQMAGLETVKRHGVGSWHISEDVQPHAP